MGWVPAKALSVSISTRKVQPCLLYVCNGIIAQGPVLGQRGACRWPPGHFGGRPRFVRATSQLSWVGA
jgi:hypothetical protein